MDHDPEYTPTPTLTETQSSPPFLEEAPDPAPRLTIGSTIGPYTIAQVGPQGGFGAVYRASTAAGDSVAIKVMHPRVAIAARALTRFRHEATLIQRSRHPSIVKILALGEVEDGRPYIAMEWLDGVTVSQVIASRGALPLATVLTIIDGLCSALAAVHAAGIVHRDIKGSNVMLIGNVDDRDELQVKLLDFGIAKLVDHSLKLTRTGMQVGTPGYMAPEQRFGRLVGPPADIYALGILVFRLLTGQLPHEYGELTTLTENADVTDLSNLLARTESCPHLSPPVRHVLARCVASEPHQRYASVEEFMEHLRDAAAPSGAPLPGAFRTRTTMGMGLSIAIRDGGERDAEQLNAGRARICEAEGFTVVRRQPRTLLAVATLPADPAAARAVRARWLRLALRVARPDQGACARASVTVHAAQMVELLIEGLPQYTGGELLTDDVWAQAGPVDCVLATTTALDGIAESFTTEAFAPASPGPDPMSHVIVRGPTGSSM